ncbi:hypothetical protein O3G_MSEX012174 [Manduca sexta]|uniref:Uncharacterized protein n=1 Tax=Manduca sexta TaxID=7130 RepID=A0A921ZN31_MANSE|nr:hypothetical protein O3G_MSEX012174 [Manduca sexta]
MTDIQGLFKQHCIVPDVINTAPSELLNVQYSSGVNVELGKELTPTQVKDKPIVKWAAKENEYYTLAMVDPDAPSRENPKFREWHHWLVGIYLAEILTKKCDFSKMPKLPSNSGDKRGKFSISKFAQQYKLGSPIAGNFYVAQYDDYVPKLYAKLKG